MQRRKRTRRSRRRKTNGDDDGCEDGAPPPDFFVGGSAGPSLSLSVSLGLCRPWRDDSRRLLRDWSEAPCPGGGGRFPTAANALRPLPEPLGRTTPERGDLWPRAARADDFAPRGPPPGGGSCVPRRRSGRHRHHPPQSPPAERDRLRSASCLDRRDRGTPDHIDQRSQPERPRPVSSSLFQGSEYRGARRDDEVRLHARRRGTLRTYDRHQQQSSTR